MLLSKKDKNAKKYPSSEFVYSACLEDYNRVLANYDKIYDRINIALTVCGVLLLVFLENVKFTGFLQWDIYSNLERTTVLIDFMFSLGSATLIIIATIQLLILARSRELLSFDSNSIKEQKLYNEKVEDAVLWVTLQYLRVINDIRERVCEKQKKYDLSITLMIIALLLYVLSKLIG